MNKINSSEALNLLLQNINNKSDLLKPENSWILHSIYVGIAGMRIAEKLKLNGEYALTIGYLHDIGKKFDYENHPIKGYFYLKKLGYNKIARYSLTHSYLNNDINQTIETNLNYDTINKYLNSINKDLFDNILHLSNLLCNEKGFTTIEKSLLNKLNKKNPNDNLYSYYMNLIDFKNWLENSIKDDLYNLFPEILKEDYNDRLIDKNTLISIIKPKCLSKIKKL